MLAKINKASSYLGQVARLMIGISSYEVYCQHIKTNHPHQTIMTYEEFFKYKQNARFGDKNNIKCC